MRKSAWKSLFLCLSFSLLQAGIQAEEWPRFRGPFASGVSASAALPDSLDDDSILWQVDSGQGGSSPIIVNDRLFFTSFDEDRRILRCLDPASGTSKWQQEYVKKRDEVATKPCGPATPTPVADAHAVIAFFADTGLVCCSLDGEKKWQKDIGPFHAFHGISSSPILVEDKVILLIDQLRDSFLAAFDRNTGEQQWKIGRLNGTVGGYATPTVNTTSAGDVEVIVPGPLELTSVDPETGGTNWFLRGVTNAPISVPVISDGRLFVCEPFYESNPFDVSNLKPYDKNNDEKISLEEVAADPNISRLLIQIDANFGNGDKQVTAAEVEKAFSSYVNSGGLSAIELGGKGDVTATHLQWAYQKTVPQVASPIHLNGVTYAINDGGVMIALNSDNGELLRKARLSRGGRQFYASPVAASGKIYLLNTDGKMTVVKAESKESLRSSKDWQELSTYDFEEPCFATPSIWGDRIYVRTQSKLYCFGSRS